MHRRSLVVLAVAALSAAACRKDGPGTAPPIQLATHHISDDTGQVQVDIGYRAEPEREVEIVVDLKAIGIEEMDKIVVDIVVDGFVLVAGEPEWSGFVAPRLPIKHHARFRLLDGNDAGTLTVTVHRSMNSEVLFEAPLPFSADGDRVKPTDGA
jgi:hypothetical protein